MTASVMDANPDFYREDVGGYLLRSIRWFIDMTKCDGLRLDAVPYLFERDGTNCENLPETHAMLREIRDPRVGFVTLTGVTVTQDLSHAKIRVSVQGDEDAKQKALSLVKGVQAANEMLHIRVLGLATIADDVTPELALQQAAAADEALARGEIRSPLQGIPLAIKDNICVAGVPMMNGSRAARSRIHWLSSTHGLASTTITPATGAATGSFPARYPHGPTFTRSSRSSSSSTPRSTSPGARTSGRRGRAWTALPPSNRLEPSCGGLRRRRNW